MKRLDTIGRIIKTCGACIYLKDKWRDEEFNHGRCWHPDRPIPALITWRTGTVLRLILADCPLPDADKEE